MRRNLHLSGIGQIDANISNLTAQLQNPNLSAWDRAFLKGRLRELRAARWLVNKLLATPDVQPVMGGSRDRETANVGRSLQDNNSALVQPAEIDDEPGQLLVRETGVPVNLKALQSELFDATVAKLESRLSNLTDAVLEIDILRSRKKRELFSIILRQLEELLDELRFSEVLLSQIAQKRDRLMLDLWQQVSAEFFGKYYTLSMGDRHFEVMPVLLQDVEIVESEILDKIPLVVELLIYLLFQETLTINNVSYPARSPKAMLRAEALLQNVMIQVANAVVQPLLNYFADVEEIKQAFYDRRWLSTRSIEKFRNNLSWKYRLEKYINEPTAIFESRYWLFVLNEGGIAKISIYAPRRQELAQMSGLPLVVTYALESRDAIAPPLRSAVSFLGSGLVYVLTQVIGRGIGLIGRGIIQGIGTSWQESKFGKNNQRK